MTKEKAKKYLLKEDDMTRQNVENCKTKAIKKEDDMTDKKAEKNLLVEEVMSGKIDTQFYPIKMNVFTRIDVNSQDPKIAEDGIMKFSLSLKGAIEIAKILMDEGNTIGEITISDSYGAHTFNYSIGPCF